MRKSFRLRRSFKMRRNYRLKRSCFRVMTRQGLQDEEEEEEL